MTFKPTTDFAELMAQFQPDRIAKMFDPEQFKSMFELPTPPGGDFSKVVKANRKNFEAMVAANKAATAAYKDFYEMQMKVFGEVMEAAKQKMSELGSAPDPDAARKQSELFDAAVQKGLGLMAELAKAYQKANQDAFAIVKARLEETVAELKQ